ncbi:MAG: alpha/beta hydrolase [Gammaproteobacteria bacterium]|nr:alpha/beta hydrolase [Gammaproteobacteria bacterium]
MINDSFITLADGRKPGFMDYGKPDGLPVFLLHGTPGSRIWDFENEPMVTDEGLRIITPERPGYGISGALKSRAISDYYRDIEQLANHLKIKQFHIAGLSGCGPYARACASALPNNILSVTLIGSATPFNMDGFFEGMSSGNKLAFRISKLMPFLLKPLYSYVARVLRKNPAKLIEQIQSQLSPWDKAVLKETEQKGHMTALISHITEAYRQGAKGHIETLCC